ncbi:MAG: hypothetical protein K1X95_09790 [Acidimicrobiia bacterium]|nr:hypothetical protein [Acidimicrobiia bacterium]
MGVMRVLGPEGDTRAVEWTREEQESIDAAEAVFRQLLEADRMVPFARAAGARADEASQLHAFDPDAEEILWVRPITGG